MCKLSFQHELALRLLGFFFQFCHFTILKNFIIVDGEKIYKMYMGCKFGRIGSAKSAILVPYFVFRIKNLKNNNNIKI